MRNIAALLVSLSLSTAVAAPINAFNFAGVKWLSTRAETKNQLASKGYKFLGICKDIYSNCTAYDANDQYFEGNVLELPARITARYNHEGRLVLINVRLEMEEGKLFSKYEGSQTILKQKYGKATEITEKYDAPYSKGSAFQALAIGKASIYSFWNSKKDSNGRYEQVLTELDRRLYLSIVYYSQYWDAEYERRNSGGGNDL